MIVDCYTHTWESPDQLGRSAASMWTSAQAETCGSDGGQATAEHSFAGNARHFAAAEPVEKTIVLGFKSKYLGADIPNDRLAAYIRNHRDRLIGFASVDPSAPREAIDDLRRAKEEFDMPGVVVAPAAQDFHPSNSQAMLVYAEAAEMGMPIIFHTGVAVTADTKLEYARPILLDEIARDLPDLRMVIAHLGHPWVGETLLLLEKHRNVHAEISWLLHQPWQAYQSLLSAYQSGVMEKLLFGSGFPHLTAARAIEALYSINHLVHGTNLPTIPREHLRGIVERDALTILGIADTVPQTHAQQVAPVVSDDEHDDI